MLKFGFRVVRLISWFLACGLSSNVGVLSCNAVRARLYKQLLILLRISNPFYSVWFMPTEQGQSSHSEKRKSASSPIQQCALVCKANWIPSIFGMLIVTINYIQSY